DWLMGKRSNQSSNGCSRRRTLTICISTLLHPAATRQRWRGHSRSAQQGRFISAPRSTVGRGAKAECESEVPPLKRARKALSAKVPALALHPPLLTIGGRLDAGGGCGDSKPACEGRSCSILYTSKHADRDHALNNLHRAGQSSRQEASRETGQEYRPQPFFSRGRSDPRGSRCP